MGWLPTCEGPNEERAARCQEQAEAYQVLSKFYRLEKTEQKAFAAFVNVMIEENENGKSAPKNQRLP